ncbi:hypothetical protein PGT21_006757 [Puccinia graminis f. sp. tritici]|nr:hypothetical protein PGT21_006757 [Puccinia graminis f. sp. tritici]
MERVDEAAHTQRVAEQLIPLGTASKAGKSDQGGPAVRRKSQEVSSPGPQLVSDSNGDHAVINDIDDSSGLRPSDLESKGPKADSTAATSNHDQTMTHVSGADQEIGSRFAMPSDWRGMLRPRIQKIRQIVANSWPNIQIPEAQRWDAVTYICLFLIIPTHFLVRKMLSEM